MAAGVPGAGGKLPSKLAGGGGGGKRTLNPIKMATGKAKNIGKQAWQRINPKQRETFGKKVQRKVVKTGLTLVKIGWSITKTTTKWLLRPGPHQPWGWLAFVIILLGWLCAVTILLYMAAGGLFAPEVADRVSPVEREIVGVHDDIPTAYLDAYKSAAAKYNIPWEILAAWGWVATDHGRWSPYDCIWRIDPASGVAWSNNSQFLGGSVKTELDSVNSFSYSSPALGGAKVSVAYPVTNKGWEPRQKFWSADGCEDGSENKTAGVAAGWNVHFCPEKVGMADNFIAPDPPIAPTSHYTSEADYVHQYKPIGSFRTGDNVHLDCTNGQSSDYINIASKLNSVSNSTLCGPMLLKSSLASCLTLQDINIAADLAAKAIDEKIQTSISQPQRYFPAKDRERTPKIGDNQETLYIFYDQWGEGASPGQVIRGTAGMYPAYWGNLLWHVLNEVSSVEVGWLGNCGVSNDSTTSSVLKTKSTITNSRDYTASEKFAGEIVCNMSANGVPMYHDWRGYTTPNEGYATGRLAASLWAKDAIQVAWFWNSWKDECKTEGDRLGSGGTAPGDTSEPVIIPEYAGKFLPLPPPRSSENGLNQVIAYESTENHPNLSWISSTGFINQFAPLDDRPCSPFYSLRLPNEFAIVNLNNRNNLEYGKIEADLAVRNWQVMGWGGFYRKVVKNCLPAYRDTYQDKNGESKLSLASDNLDGISHLYDEVQEYKGICTKTTPCRSDNFKIGYKTEASSLSLWPNITAFTNVEFSWELNSEQVRYENGIAKTVHCPLSIKYEKADGKWIVNWENVQDREDDNDDGDDNDYFFCMKILDTDNAPEIHKELAATYTIHDDAPEDWGDEQFEIKYGSSIINDVTGSIINDVTASRCNGNKDPEDISGEKDIKEAYKGATPNIVCAPKKFPDIMGPTLNLAGSLDISSWVCKTSIYATFMFTIPGYTEPAVCAKITEDIEQETGEDDDDYEERKTGIVDNLVRECNRERVNIQMEEADRLNNDTDFTGKIPFTSYPDFVVQSLFWNPNTGLKYGYKFGPDNDWSEHPVGEGPLYSSCRRTDWTEESVVPGTPGDVSKGEKSGYFYLFPPTQLMNCTEDADNGHNPEWRAAPVCGNPYYDASTNPNTISFSDMSECSFVEIFPYVLGGWNSKAPKYVDEYVADGAVPSRSFDRVPPAAAYANWPASLFNNYKFPGSNESVRTSCDVATARRSGDIEVGSFWWAVLQARYPITIEGGLGNRNSITQSNRSRINCDSPYNPISSFNYRNGNRPILPSLAYPPVGSSSPHSWVGWVSENPYAGISDNSLHVYDGISFYPDNFVAGFLGSGMPPASWSAGQEIAHRARWLAGGVQQEDSQTVNVNGRKYVVQDMVSKYTICNADRHWDRPFTDYEADMIDISSKHFTYRALKDETSNACLKGSEDYYKGNICNKAMIAAGEVCRLYAEMVTRAKEDGIVLRGSAWRNKHSQVKTFTRNCPTITLDAMFRLGVNVRRAAREQDVSCNAALPGRSWHELATAVDFVDSSNTIISTVSPEYHWLTQHAWRWGFINLKGEPWHWSMSGA